MKLFQTLARSLTMLACLGMLLPGAAMAEGPAARRVSARVLDVSLHDGGLLVGQVVNAAGKSLQNVEVTIASRGRELAKTRTDSMGRFAVKGLAGGNYYLATKGSLLSLRAWSKGTAPPSSAIGAMLVEGPTVRAQYGTEYGAASFNQNQGGFGQTFNTSVLASDDSAGVITPTPADGVDSGEYTYTEDGSTCQDCYGGGGYGGHGGGYNHGIFGHKKGWLSNPWIIGTGVAAAIAIPIALDDDDAS